MSTDTSTSIDAGTDTSTSAGTSSGLRDLRALTRAQWAGFWREKQNWFWLLAFPLMFLFLFGFLFRDVGASKTELAVIGEVPFITQMPSEGKQQFDELFEITEYDDREAALAAVRKGDLDGAVEATGDVTDAAGSPGAMEMTLHYSAADSVVAATVQGTLGGFVQTANVAASGEPPRFVLNTDQVEDASLEPIQFLAPGLLGWAIAMGATFNTSLPFVMWRTSQLLRRLRLSPVRPGALVTSRLLVCLSVAFIQTAIFLGLGTALFGLKLTGNWWLALPLIALGTLAFMAIGMVAGAVSKTVEAASGLVNVIILPMAFLSGSFIPLEDAPGWMITFAKFLPLGQLNEGMMDVMVRGEGIASLAVPSAVLLAFTVLFGVIAAKLFRWDDKAS